MIDDTLFRRRGKTWAASWFHDGSAPGPRKTGRGNNWVIAAVVVRLPAVRRPVAIPVLAKLVIKDTNSASRLWLARRMAEMLAGALPGRHIHVVADSAYAGGELKKLPPRVTWTTRLRKDAALHGLPPQRTRRRGRPRQKGDRLPCLAKLTATTAFTQVTVTRYGKAAAVHAAAVTCRTWPNTGPAPPGTPARPSPRPSMSATVSTRWSRRSMRTEPIVGGCRDHVPGARSQSRVHRRAWPRHGPPARSPG